MSFKNRWTISSSYDFQVHQQRFQRRCWFSQTAVQWFEVLPDLSPALPGLLPALPGMLPALPGMLPALPGVSPALPGLSPALPGLSQALPGTPRVVVGAPRLVTGTPGYSEGRQECPPRVWYSPEIDPSKFTLHILSDTPGGFQWQKYILLMYILCIPTLNFSMMRHMPRSASTIKIVFQIC